MSAEEPSFAHLRRLLTLASARHPSLPAVEDVELAASGCAGIRWEPLPETTLRDVVEREGPSVLPDLAAEGLRALGLLHDLGASHGALVPSAVRVRAMPRLGARLVLAPPPVAAVDLASAIETLPFVPPEVLAGASWTHAADLYAFGAVLFHALHGRTHVRTDGDVVRARAAIRDGRRSRPHPPDGTPAGLADWIEGWIEIDPVRRPRLGDALARLGARSVSPADRASSLASGRPPGLERPCEELSRELERPDGARVVLVPARRGSGAGRVLDWIALVVCVSTGPRAVQIRGPVDATVAFQASGGRVVAEIRPGRFGARPWPGVRVMQVPTTIDRETARAIAMRVRGPDRTAATRLARLLVRAARCYDDALLLAACADARGDSRSGVLTLVRELTVEARSIARLLDAIGTGLAPEDVARLAGVTEEAARSAAAELWTLGWLSARPARWVASLPADLHRALPPLDGATRDRLRESARRADSAGDAALAIRLWSAAGEPDVAIATAVEASERALDRGAAHDAAELVRAVLENLPRRDPRRAELRVRQGRALERAGCLHAAGKAFAGARRAEARHDLQRVRARLESLDGSDRGGAQDPRSAASVRLRDAARRVAECRLDAARTEASGVADFARATDDRRLAAIAEAIQSAGAGDEGATASAVALVRGWQDVRSAIAGARAALGLGRAQDAARIAAEAASAADAIDAPGEAAEAWSIVAETEGDDPGRPDEARREGRARLEVALGRVSDPALRRVLADHPRFAGLRARPASQIAVDRRLLAIYDMIRRLNSEVEPESLLSQMLSMALDVVRAERGLILLFSADGSVRVRAARQLDGTTLADAESFSRGVVAEAGTGRSVIAVDATADERFADLRSVSLYGIRSLLCVPLRSRGRLIGTVYADHRGERGRFDAEDLRFLEAFADHAALAIENVEARAALDRENRELRAVAVERSGESGLLGESEAMRRILDRIRVAASSDLPVLITGESGTGKELAARAIHFQGGRRHGPFVTENCAALPESLLEAELFGHVRGAFTGAERDRAGLFEQADHGTLLLDEIGDMSPRMQAQLLRVLESGQVRRVGGDRTRSVDVRLVAATHRDLEARTRDGTFRADLFYRLQVLTIEMPPLRERPGDVRLLVSRFLSRMATERGRDVPRILPAALDRLERHAWPGNVRELANVVARAVVLAGDGPITSELLASDPALRGGGTEAELAPVRTGSLAESERRVIAEALHAAGGNRARAARLLGISRATMYRRLRQE